MGKEKTANALLKIVHKPAPYPGFFRLPEEKDQKPLEKMSKGWNRWDSTRYLNPFIEGQTATGFEGYFVGLGFPPHEVALQIAQMGANALKSLKLMHQGNPAYISCLWKVARGERYDAHALAELNSILLANMARLRVQIHPQSNPQGDRFRSSVAQLVGAETMSFHGENNVVQEHAIAVPKERKQAGAISVDVSIFHKDELRDGYEFMRLLGKAGYPLVQLALHR